MEGGRGRLKSCERRNMVPKERRKHHQKSKMEFRGERSNHEERAGARLEKWSHQPPKWGEAINFPAANCAWVRQGPPWALCDAP